MTIMNVTNFRLLSLGELENFWGELDFAIEEHYRWLGLVNRTLLFNDKVSSDDLADDAHLRCHFGRFYQSQANSTIMSLPSFIEIGNIHQQIHASAREILNKCAKDCLVERETYGQLMNLSKRLRAAVNELKRDIKSDISTISMLLSKVFEHAAEGVMITAADGTILNVNKAFTKLTGFNHEESVGKTANILFSGRHDDEYFQKMWHELTTTGYWDGEIWNRRKSGEIYPEYLTISAQSDSSGEISHYIGIFTDASSNGENQDKLYRLAHYDALTELPNRILFHDRLSHAIAVAKRAQSNIAVLFLDLDGFKAVNDQYGHKNGDILLKQVTCRIKSCLRDSDTVGRFGGDEFTVVLPGIGDDRNIDAVASKIIAAIGKPYSIAGEEVNITASIGISCYPSEAEQTESLIEQADMAMYAAKRGGRNRFCHYAERMG